ncbi:unnamed protein product [Closterium sp. NIES-53]
MDQYPHPAGVQRTTHGATEGGGCHDCAAAAAGADYDRSRPSAQLHPDQLQLLRHRLLHRRHPRHLRSHRHRRRPVVVVVVLAL